MTVSDQQEYRDSVVYLEAMCGQRLDEVPVDIRDQWTTNIRDVFRNLDVDLNDTKDANAAFIGARFAVAILMSGSPNSGTTVAHYLRYLMDKSDGYKDTGKRRKARLWFGRKVMPK